jgi:hypothetical protein
MGRIGAAMKGGEASSPDTPQQEGDPGNMGLAEIATFRRENKIAYFKNDAMRARELELLEAQEPAAGSPDKPWWDDSQPDAQHDSEHDAGQELIAVEDLPPDMQPAREFADSVLAEDAMSTETINAFAMELSPVAQDALIEEMKLSPDMDAEPASDEQLAEFRDTYEGAAVSEEWGDEAAEKYGVVRHRWNRLRNDLPSHERDTFDELFDSLPPAAVQQVYRELAG